MASLKLILPSYNALPIIAPLTPAFSKSFKSFISPTPPEAIISISVIFVNFAVADTFTPESMPSLLISVNTICFTPASFILIARDSASVFDTFSQPCVATFPSFASIPTTILSSPNSFIADKTKSGSFNALVPSMHLFTPKSRSLFIESNSLIPPPTCTGIFISSHIIFINFVFTNGL